MRIFMFIFTVFFTFTTGVMAQDDRILVKAKVNGKAVLLIFDSGTTHTTLFERATKRLNLKISYPPATQKPGEISLGTTEKCSFTLGNSTVTAELKVFKAPGFSPTGIDGILAWGDVKETMCRIDGQEQKITGLNKIPEDLSEWTKWILKEDSRSLAFYLSEARDALIYIDTGSPQGVELNQKRWSQWRKDHSNKPRTLNAIYNPTDGIVITETFWADTFTIGDFTIKNVPVEGAPPSYKMRKCHEATLGIVALSRMEIICDGKGSIYTRQIQNKHKSYQYNKIGAVFVPDNMSSAYLKAHVIKECPAWKAGIRDGDILLAIGSLDVTQWRTNPQVLPLSRFFDQPAEAILDLTVKRDGDIFKVKVKLENLLEL